MKQFWHRLVLLITVLLLASGCAARQRQQALPSPISGMAEKESVEVPAAPMPAPPPAPMEDSYRGSAEEQLPGVGDRMIIRTVSMSMVVNDTDNTLAAVRDLADEYKGYIADSRRWLRNDQPYANVTLRVPAQSLDAVLERLRALAIKIESENLTGQDVTEEYVDLQARLRNLEATEAELLALLTEVRENRGKAEDILAIHRELTNIRGQIESLKGRSQYLERMTALATIQLEIRPKEAPRPLVEKARWNPLVTISNALRGFVQVLQVMVDLAIYVLVFSPFILVPVVILWLIVRAIRRRKQRRAEKGA